MQKMHWKKGNESKREKVTSLDESPSRALFERGKWVIEGNFEIPRCRAQPVGI